VRQHPPIRRKQAIERAHDPPAPAAHSSSSGATLSPAFTGARGLPTGHDIGSIAIYPPGWETAPADR